MNGHCNGLPAELTIGTGADPLFDEPATARPKPARMPRGANFVRVWQLWLTDPLWRGYFPARLRLYLYLRHLTRDGLGPPVRLNNEMAGHIGLSRQRKMEYLRELERDGLVKLTTADNHTVEVSVMPVAEDTQPGRWPKQN
jgi:hypothetical protein